MASFTCDECGARAPGEPELTPTGRRLCPDCWARLMGAAAGAAAGGGIGAAVATSGWFARLRGGRRRPAPPRAPR